MRRLGRRADRGRFVSRLTRAVRISGQMTSRAPDMDAYMRIHALHGGRVYVTRNGYQPRDGVLIAWQPHGRFVAEVRYDGSQRSLHLPLKRYGVLAIR